MAWNPIWERVFSSQPWGKYPGEDLIRFVARNFYAAPDRAAVRVLEVGSGTGANLWFLAREGFAAFGVEGSPTAARQSLDRLGAECAGWDQAPRHMARSSWVTSRDCPGPRPISMQSSIPRRSIATATTSRVRSTVKCIG